MNDGFLSTSTARSRSTRCYSRRKTTPCAIAADLAESFPMDPNCAAQRAESYFCGCYVNIVAHGAEGPSLSRKAGTEGVCEMGPKCPLNHFWFCCHSFSVLQYSVISTDSYTLKAPRTLKPRKLHTLFSQFRCAVNTSLVVE